MTIIITGLPFTAKERFPRTIKISRADSEEDARFILKRVFDHCFAMWRAFRECQVLESAQRILIGLNLLATSTIYHVINDQEFIEIISQAKSTSCACEQ